MTTTLNLPTVVNPLVLNITGHVPALKNNKMTVPTKKGKTAIVSNVSVKVFYESVGSTCLRQIQRQGFDRIPFPTPIAVFTELWFYVANATNISASDGDNAFTTLQEMLQQPRRNAKYYLGVADDDKQVSSHHVETYAVKDPNLEGARMFVWTLDWDMPRRKQWDMFNDFYDQYSHQAVYQPDIDFDEVLDLLS